MKLAIMGLEAERTGYALPLRAYALQTVLAQEGHKAELVLYRPQQPRPHRDPISLTGALLSRMIHRKSRHLTALRTRRFARFYQDLTTPPKIREGALALVEMPAYDGYISGPGAGAFCGNTMQAYCHTYVRGAQPKIAYAVSSEGAEPSDGAFASYLSQAKGLTALSVREEKLVDRLARHGIGAGLHVDPVLLLSATEWMEHTAPMVVPDIPYGVCHFEEKDPLARKTVSDLARTYGVPMFNISERGITFSGTDKRYQNCDPRTFVKLISRSAFCVGDSYLLACLGALFQKPMLLLAREKTMRTVRPFLSQIGREVCYVGRGELNEQVVKLMQQNTAARGLSSWQDASREFLVRQAETVKV